MGIIDNIKASLKSSDTIFYKETSELQNRYNALTKLNEDYPNNDDLIKELYNIKKGLDGENEIAYQLKKAHIGMYVLRDIKIKYTDLTAQFDFVVITPLYTYYIECKNLTGNITVNEKGEFIREYIVDGKKIKKGMYSPLRQVEAEREVLRKIWETKISKIKKIFASNYFNYYRRVLVVISNPETILSTSKAPKDIKNKVIRADALINTLEHDYEARKETDPFDSLKQMEETAKSYLKLSINENIDYYEYYKNKYNLNYDTYLKVKLLQFRKERTQQMHIPAFYVFTNEELDKLIELKPKTLEELKKSNILNNVKVDIHGKNIIEIFNSKK